MSDIRIEVFPGKYDNDDAYNRVLGYIGQKTYLGGYGFSCGPGPTIIEQFQLSEHYSRFQNAQKIWHFVITFSESWRHQQLLCIGRDISEFFKDSYQVLFGLDTDKKIPHLHFGVNAFSYDPLVPVLGQEKMKEYMLAVQDYLRKAYYPMSVTLQFQGKGC